MMKGRSFIISSQLILCAVRGAELMAGSDAREAPWVGRDDLHKFGLAPVTLKVIFKGLHVR